MLRTLLLIGGIIVAVYLVLATGPGEILAPLARIGWGFVPIATLYGGHQALRAWALRLSAARPGAVAYGDALAVRLSGDAIQFLTSTGFFLAEPSKPLLRRPRVHIRVRTRGFSRTIVASIGAGSRFAWRCGRRLRSLNAETPQSLYRSKIL